MTCPFCAEEIRDAAVLCRFCGATRVGGEWRPPSAPPAGARKGEGTALLRASGVLLIGGAVLEAIGGTDPVVIAGAARTGAAAVAVHAVLALAYAAAGIGLWTMRRAGYRVVLGVVALVTVDRLAFLFDGVSIPAWVDLQAAALEGFADLVDPADLALAARAATWGLLAGWWLLALVVFRARRRFGAAPGTAAGTAGSRS